MKRAKALHIVALIGLTVAAAACGAAKSTPSAPTPQVVATSSIPPLPPLTDAAGTALVARQGTLYAYDISLPEAWKPGESKAGYDTFNVPNPLGKDASGKELLAGFVAIQCGRPAAAGETARSLADRAVAGTQAGGQIGSVDPAGVSDVQVGALSAATLKTTLSFGSILARTYHYYVSTPDCAWEVALNLYSPGDDAPYWDLFDRVAQTFRPRGGG